MKRRFKVLIILAVLLTLVVGSGMIAVQVIEGNLEHLVGLPVQSIKVTTIEDGAYRGAYASFPVAAEVEVVLKDQRITDIRIIKHEHGQGSAAEGIIEEVIRKQSLQVDSVTGATYSSKVILKAIEDALTGTE
jgi:uncharacterized protein with FMN-binding domain